MRLTARRKKLLNALIAGACPLAGIFYRSVEFRWMHPDDLVSGSGTAKLGGRFAAPGTRAVYASDSEETVLREISIRRQRLGGRAQIDVDRWPRVTFRLDIRLTHHVDLTGPFSNVELEQLRVACLDVNSLTFSQQVGRYFVRSGVQGIVFSPGASVLGVIRCNDAGDRSTKCWLGFPNDERQ